MGEQDDAEMGWRGPRARRYGTVSNRVALGEQGMKLNTCTYAMGECQVHV